MSFFADVPSAPPDPLLSIDGRFKSDSRDNKLNLGIGVLRKSDGTSHEFATVLKAAKMVSVCTYYPSPAGDAEFVKLSSELVFGEKEIPARVMGVQTVGGSGALRVCAELLVSQGIVGMMLPNPSGEDVRFQNTPTVCPPLYVLTCVASRAQLVTKNANILAVDESTHLVDIEAMITAIKKAPAKSAVMLQVAAHNPTGVDLTDDQWERVLETFKERRDVFPVFDSAYQGLARGLEEDVKIVRRFLKEGLEFAVCNSHSKNFGLYGERVGTCFVACQTPEIAANVSSRCQLRIRWNYSVPPLHGAKIVATILKDPELRKEWEEELVQSRQQLNKAHAALAGALKAGNLPDKFSSPRYGLFSQLFLSDQQVQALETQHGVYVGPGGRINVSSLTDVAAKTVAEAVIAIVK